MLHDNAYTVYHRYPGIAAPEQSRRDQAKASAVPVQLKRILWSAKSAVKGAATSYSAAGKKLAAS